jgi:hypothetical protein
MTLKADGRKFWRSTVARWELSTAELHVLAQASATLDTIADLEQIVAATGPMGTGSRGQAITSPALQELRLQRLALARIMSCLDLPDEAEPESRSGGWMTPSESGRAAARRRWSAGGTRG